MGSSEGSDESLSRCILMCLDDLVLRSDIYQIFFTKVLKLTGDIPGVSKVLMKVLGSCLLIAGSH